MQGLLFLGSVLLVLGGSCLSQFQICVRVSGLVRLLSVSKFSLCQSASTVTKSLRCPAGASCQSHKQLCVHKMNSHEIPAVHLHRDTTDILKSQLFKGHVKQCKFSSQSIRSELLEVYQLFLASDWAAEFGPAVLVPSRVSTMLWSLVV